MKVVALRRTSRSFGRAAVYFGAMMLGSGAAALAQDRVDLRGRVLRSSDRAPLGQAVIELVDLRKADTSTAAGTFAFRGIPEGVHRIRVRRLGYLPYVDAIHVSARDANEHVVLVPEVATALPVVTVSGRRVDVPLRFMDPYRRAQEGSGHFFTREHIEELDLIDLEPLMNRIPGVRMNDRGITFERCQSGLASPLPGTARPPAKVQVWVDGFRLTGRTRGAESLPHAVLRSVPPSSIQIIEVYTGVANIPVEYLDDACAVVLIWTKSY